MSLATNIQTLATAIGTDIKQVRTWTNGNAADLTGLSTTTKTSLLAAINEVKAQADALAGAGTVAINDTTASTTSVYSSTKTDTSIAAAVSALVASSPAALDTLNELATALGNDAAFATTTATALGNRVRYDTAQTLTGPQKTQALANIGAATAAQGTLADAAVPSTRTVAGKALSANVTLVPADVGAAAASHTHTAANISDSTATGRLVLMAADAATARTALGAGTSSLAIGTTTGTAADAALVGATTTNFVTSYDAAKA